MLTIKQINALADAIEGAVTADGRGLHVPTIVLDILDGELCLRIDDEERPEFWLSLRLPACAVLAMAELVQGHATDEGDTYATTDADDTDADPFLTA